MALSASTVWEVRAGGSDTANGGGFVTGASGTDYSQQNSPQYSLTGLTSAGAGNVILTASASADMIGNILRVTGGTNFTVGWFQITAVSVGVSITVSTNSAGTGVTTGVGASGTAAVGGALASPGIAALNMTVAGMVAYICNQGTTFSITSASVNVSGGVIGATVAGLIVGYATNRNPANTDSPPTLQLNVASATMFNSNFAVAINLICDGNAQTSAKLTNSAQLIGCTLKNFNTASTGSGVFFGCLITFNSATVGTGVLVAFCEAYGNTATPIISQYVINCLSYGNTGASTNGISAATYVVGCTCVANGSNGIVLASPELHLVENCILQSNGAFGINNGGFTFALLINNAFFGNTSGQVSGSAPAGYNLNPITYSGDAFTNTSGNVYSFNNLASQGAALRAKALPAFFPRGLTPDYLDMGAAQHQDTGGSSGMLFIPNMEGT